MRLSKGYGRAEYSISRYQFVQKTDYSYNIATNTMFIREPEHKWDKEQVIVIIIFSFIVYCIIIYYRRDWHYTGPDYMIVPKVD